MTKTLKENKKERTTLSHNKLSIVLEMHITVKTVLSWVYNEWNVVSKWLFIIDYVYGLHDIISSFTKELTRSFLFVCLCVCLFVCLLF